MELDTRGGKWIGIELGRGVQRPGRCGFGACPQELPLGCRPILGLRTLLGLTAPALVGQSWAVFEFNKPNGTVAKRMNRSPIYWTKWPVSRGSHPVGNANKTRSCGGRSPRSQSGRPAT